MNLWDSRLDFLRDLLLAVGVLVFLWLGLSGFLIVMSPAVQ